MATQTTDLNNTNTTGITLPAVDSTTAVPSTINSSMLGQTPVTVPVPTTPPPNPGSSTYATPNLADQILKDTAVTDTATQTKASDLSTKISDLLPSLLGQSTALVTEQKNAGLPDLKQNLQNINNQILTKQAELQKSDTQLIADSRAAETRDTLLPFAQSAQAKLAGDAAIMRALKTSEIGVLNAQALAAQGNIQLAQETAQQAVDAKYAPIKEQIANYQAQLTALAPILTKDEKKQADAQQLKVDLAKKQLDQKVQSDKDIANIQLEAAKNGASQDLLSTIGKATSVGDAIKAAGSALSTPTTETVKIGDGAVLIDKRTGKILNTYGNTGGGDTNGVNVPTTAPADVKAISSIAGLVGGFSSVNAQKMFLKNISTLAEQGNTTGIAEKVVGQALANIPDSDTKKRTTGGFLISQQLTRLQGLLDDYKAGGGNTGLLTGKIQDIKQKVGQVGDPNLANLGVQIANTLDELARTRTGAVIGPKEQEFYDSILPGTSKSKELNDQLISGLKDSLMADVESNLRFSVTNDGLAIIKSTLPDLFSNTSSVDNYVTSGVGGSQTISGQQSDNAISAWLNSFQK